MVERELGRIEEWLAYSEIDFTRSIVVELRETARSLIAEVRRLRGFLASVEYGGECNFCNKACLFCMACHCSEDKRAHAPGCLIFTPDGELK